jgi:hypothetical protein
LVLLGADFSSPTGPKPFTPRKKADGIIVQTKEEIEERRTRGEEEERTKKRKKETKTKTNEREEEDAGALENL